MTDDELNAKVEMEHAEWIAVEELRAEVSRLRGLIAKATPRETMCCVPFCFWCDMDKSLPHAARYREVFPHTPDCPAFTQEGVVR